MKTSTKIKSFLIVFLLSVFAIITVRHFIGLHFQKKFSVRPAPGIIIKTAEKSLFFHIYLLAHVLVQTAFLPLPQQLDISSH